MKKTAICPRHEAPAMISSLGGCALIAEIVTEGREEVNRSSDPKAVRLQVSL